MFSRLGQLHELSPPGKDPVSTGASSNTGLWPGNHYLVQVDGPIDWSKEHWVW